MGAIDPQTGLPEGYAFQPDWEVTPVELRDAMAGGEGPALIDCRLPDEAEVAAIEGATLVPMQQLAGRLDELAELRDKPVVVHCHLGGRSMKVTQFLRQQGFSDVKSLAGGIDAWSRAIDADVPRY
ncbi:MAG: rhodanese-like domain-containing protein [Planctomycetota bacterium]